MAVMLVESIRKILRKILHNLTSPAFFKKLSIFLGLGILLILGSWKLYIGIIDYVQTGELNFIIISFSVVITFSINYKTAITHDKYLVEKLVKSCITAVKEVMTDKLAISQSGHRLSQLELETIGGEMKKSFKKTMHEQFYERLFIISTISLTFSIVGLKVAAFISIPNFDAFVIGLTISMTIVYFTGYNLTKAQSKELSKNTSELLSSEAIVILKEQLLINQVQHRLSQLEINSLGKAFAKKFEEAIETSIHTIFLRTYHLGVVFLIAIIAFLRYLSIVLKFF